MSNDRTFQVEQTSQLLPFLLDKLPKKGRNKVKGLLTHRQVAIDGKIATRHDVPLKPGQVVAVASVGGIRKEELHGIRIMYEDDDIIVIDKPPGLLSMATDKERDQTAYRILTDYVQLSQPNNRIFIVHRLDRETSGVMMFAKIESIQQSLQNEWRDVVKERLYTVVVEGQVTKKEDTIKTWLKESKTHTMYVSRPGDGVVAVTHYKVLKSSSSYSLLEVELETGRKNQIRVHMQSIGHSVAGDKRYGAKTRPISRLTLHARVLSFLHPVTGELLKFETNIPPAFQRLVPVKQDDPPN